MAGEYEGYYAILGLPPGASPEAIKRAYRSLARQWHPDRFTDPETKTAAETKFKEISQAYEKLKDYTPPPNAFRPPPKNPTPPTANPPSPKPQKPKTPKPPPIPTAGKTAPQLFQIAQTYVATGDYEQAITYLSAVIERQPQNAAAYRYRGWLRSVQQRERSAASDFARAAELERQQQPQPRRSSPTPQKRATPPKPSAHAANWEQVDSIAHLGNLTSLTLRADRHLLVTANRTGSIHLGNLATGTVGATVVAHTGKVTGLALSSQGRILISSGADGYVKIWRLRSDRFWRTASLKLLHTFKTTGAIHAIASHRKTLLTAHNDGLIQRWQIPSGKSLEQFQLNLAIDWATSIVGFDPIGERLAIGDRSGYVHLTNLTGEVSQTLPAHHGSITALTFSADGWLATAGEDGICRIWDPQRGELQGVVVTRSAIRCLQFTPNSKKLIAAGDEQAIQIWRSIE